MADQGDRRKPGRPLAAPRGAVSDVGPVRSAAGGSRARHRAPEGTYLGLVPRHLRAAQLSLPVEGASWHLVENKLSAFVSRLTSPSPTSLELSRMAVDSIRFRDLAVGAQINYGPGSLYMNGAPAQPASAANPGGDTDAEPTRRRSTREPRPSSPSRRPRSGSPCTPCSPGCARRGTPCRCGAWSATWPDCTPTSSSTTPATSPDACPGTGEGEANRWPVVVAMQVGDAGTKVDHSRSQKAWIVPGLRACRLRS